MFVRLFILETYIRSQLVLNGEPGLSNWNKIHIPAPLKLTN